MQCAPMRLRRVLPVAVTAKAAALTFAIWNSGRAADNAPALGAAAPSPSQSPSPLGDEKKDFALLMVRMKAAKPAVMKKEARRPAGRARRPVRLRVSACC